MAFAILSTGANAHGRLDLLPSAGTASLAPKSQVPDSLWARDSVHSIGGREDGTFIGSAGGEDPRCQRGNARETGAIKGWIPIEFSFAQASVQLAVNTVPLVPSSRSQAMLLMLDRRTSACG